MIIGNSMPGALVGGSNKAGSATSDLDSSGTSSASEPAPQSSYQKPALGAEREAAMAMHQTARIMAFVATMRQVDDVSAYSLFAQNENGSDEYRHVVSAYGENSD